MEFGWTHIEKIRVSAEADITVDTVMYAEERTTREHLDKEVEKEMWTTGFIIIVTLFCQKIRP